MVKPQFLLLFFIFTYPVFSQCYIESGYENLDKYNVVDSAHLKCSYQLTWAKNKEKTNEKAKDFQILLIGKSISKYYSQLLYDYIQSVKKYWDKSQNYPSNPNEGTWSFELFKNYPAAGNITVTDIASALKGNYLYEEKIPALNWQITEEKQKVLSYNCLKATTTFRGRSYIAWFTTEIPIPNGPWKFGGLPGLILKLHDTEQNFIFECNGIEQLKKKEIIKFYKIDYTKTSREKLNKIYERFHEDYTKYENSQGIMLITVDPNTGERRENPPGLKLPYNPIELE
jgi:GLPGLI family protein